jgi:hypothetical protein
VTATTAIQSVEAGLSLDNADSLLSALLEDREVGPGSKERAHTPTQQMENFVDIVHLK